MGKYNCTFHDSYGIFISPTRGFAARRGNIPSPFFKMMGLGHFLTLYYLTEFFLITVAASIFIPRPPAELEWQTNFNAISKNVKILKIGPVEQKL